MATIQTEYKGELRTEAIHIGSGSKILTDAPLDNKGKGEAFSPTDLLSASLGSCMLTIMGMAAEEHKINMDGVTMEITKIMEKNPRRVGEIKIDFNFPFKSYSEKEKLILEKAAMNCPVYYSLHPDLKKTVNFNFGSESGS